MPVYQPQPTTEQIGQTCLGVNGLRCAEMGDHMHTPRGLEGFGITKVQISLQHMNAAVAGTLTLGTALEFLYSM
jgi:hypothetical protein